MEGAEDQLHDLIADRSEELRSVLGDLALKHEAAGAPHLQDTHFVATWATTRSTA